jgi:RNA polymerase sigma-70 factor (ECF subfamily)
MGVAETPATAGDLARAGAAGPLSEESDADLMRRLRNDDQGALDPLYARYAPLIYHLAAQTLGRPAAEEVVQEVFLTVWHKAASFDPQLGSFRSWVLQIAHRRILNELRRQSHRPRLSEAPLDALVSDDPEPAEAAWREYRRQAVQSAVEALPPEQRVALGLAFFGDLTHEQVARVLQLPLGTAKTRIRTALHRLRNHLAPVLAALTLLLFGVPAGLRLQAEQVERDRVDRALKLVTTSDVEPVRLTAAAGVPAGTHGTYRGRPGNSMAVFTFSALPTLPSGQAYQVWVLHGDHWDSVGLVHPDGSGTARLIAESPVLGAPPSAIQVTVEPAAGRAAPTGPVVVRWPAE